MGREVMSGTFKRKLLPEVPNDSKQIIYTCGLKNLVQSYTDSELRR
jgi:hypothetical protein